MNESKVSWSVDNEAGHLLCGSLTARIVFAELGARVYLDSWLGRKVELPFPLLHVAFGERRERGNKVADCYIRGEDLVATYEKTSPDQVAPQIYWRAASNPVRGAATIQLIISAQTDLLDSRPEFWIASYAGPAQWFLTDQLDDNSWRECSESQLQVMSGANSTTQLCLCRDQQLGMSYAQMVHPSDFVSMRLNSGPSAGLVESRLFPEHLEKGVIRRGRICGWFMPAENDLKTAVELARQFVDEPLPLTT